MNIQWTNKYPSKDFLKKDLDAMVNSTLHTLFKYFSKKDIYGIYYKGSSSKQWDSIIDYVPGISDVDIHVQFNDDSTFDKIIHSPNVACKFSEDNDKNFCSINKKFYHMPELQLNSLNTLHHSKDYRSSPVNAVKILYGKPYPITKMTNKHVKSISCNQILELRKYVLKMPGRLIDKNSSSMKKYLKDLSWQVNPLSMNFLVVKGIPYDVAFSNNRTTNYYLLKKLGFNRSANDFAGYYYHAWQYYLTNDYANLKKAILYGYKFMDATISDIE